MKKLFSTADMHARDRFDYWHNVACKNIAGHDSKPESRQAFEAEMEGDLLADIGLVLFENSAMDAWREPRHIKQVGSDELFVCRQVNGTLMLEQDSREVRLEPGDLTLLDPLLPYAAKFSAGSKLLVLKVPRRSLEARVGNTRQILLRCIRPCEAEHSLTSAFLAMLPTHTGKMTPAAEDIIKDQTLDLVAVSLAKAMEGEAPRLSSARSLARLKLRAAIEARLCDPSLDASKAAAAAGMSLRYANSLLSEEDTSVARLIQARRLARCRRALEDPLQMHRTVSEIAYAWGFSDMTHFGRRFKAAYGILPSDYRKRARQT